MARAQSICFVLRMLTRDIAFIFDGKRIIRPSRSTIWGGVGTAQVILQTRTLIVSSV